MKIAALFLFAVLVAGCGGEAPEQEITTIAETGSIIDGDQVDANYGGYRYDSYDFQVNPLDMVTVEVQSDDFDFLVTLYEVSTGAQLAEWDPEYSEEQALEYRIAGGGTCQARIYALNGGTGSYSIRITVKD